MTGEQTPEAESPPAFGEILINPQAETAENKKEDPVSPAKANKQRIPQKPQSKHSKAHQAPQPSKPKRNKRKKNKAKKAGSKKKLLCCLALILLLPAALFLSYLAAVTYLLPYYIQEQLTAQYSQQLNRPVTVTQVQFAPFSFDLHLAGIHIGPERSRKNNKEPALCRIATIDTRLRPEALLDGKLIFENVQIKGMQAEITRRADGSFTDLGLSDKEALGKTTQSLLPRWFSSWLQVDGLSLTESMFVLRDAASGHEYHLDEIAFSLPSAANQQDAQTPSLPTLHALVNGNPVQIRGERHIRPDNSSVTRLRLQLDDVDPQQLIDWLPSMGNSLRITSEKTTASLELILPDSPQPHGKKGKESKDNKEEISLSGKVSFTGLNITSLKTSSFQCKAPSAELVIQANPLRKQYQVEALTFNSPEFSFAENKSTEPFSSLPFAHWPGQLLTPASLPIDLSIQHLTIHQGTLHREDEQPWNNVQLELTGYRNQELLRGTQQKTNSATALSFSAQQGIHKVQFQGTTTPALDLIGKISLHNLDARLLNPYLETAGAGQTVQLKNGIAQLVMQVNPVQKQYTITELILDKPELFELKNFKAIKAIKSSSRPLPFSLPLDQLFNPVFLPFDLIIDQLTINQGTLQREQAQPWKNLQLKLTDYRNRELLRATKKHTSNKAKALSFSAQQGTRKVQFQGTTTPALELIGKISLQNWNARFLNPYLKTAGAGQGIQLQDGTAQLVMQVNPLEKQYIITELTLEKPKIKQLRAKKSSTSSTKQPPLALSLGQILNPASLPFHLIIHQLTIKQGTLQREQAQPWKNLQFKLTDYRNRELLRATKKHTSNKAKALSFSAQQGTRKVEFQGTTTPAFDLIGKISLHNWNARLFNPYVKTAGAGQSVQLQDGTAHLVMQVNPVQQQYTITELTLDTPQIKINNSSSSDPFPFAVPLGELFNPVSLPFDLVIDRLIINKGSIEKKQGASWQDLQLDLTAYRNGEKLSAKRKKKAAALSFAEAAALSFTARQGKMTVRFLGKVAPDLSLSGKVALRNLHSSLFQPYVGIQSLGFSGEQAALEGLIQTVQPAGEKKKILIEQAKIVLPHISMQQGGQPFLTAAVTTAEGCVLNLTRSGRGKPDLSCIDLTLQQADFSAAAPSFFLAQEKTDFLPGFSFDRLKITDSKARLPLRSSEGSSDDLTVPITDLNLEINNLQAQSQQNNLRLEARVGMHGKMSAQGNIYQGKARLELAVENLNIKLLEKPFAALFQQNFAPTLQHGLFSFQGQLQLPELNFKGKAQLNDFMAQNNQGTALRWKSGTGSHVLAGMQPFFVHIEELVVQEPKLQLGSPDRRLPGALLTLLRQKENKPVLPPFTIKQCRIQGGSLPSIDTTRNFTAVDGNLTPLAAGTPAIFTFSGKVNNRKFTAQGRLEQNQAEVDNFTVAELPLENIAQQFIEQLDLQNQGKIRWIPSDEQGNKKDKQGVIHYANFLPQQNSEYALLLGILTNKRGEFSLPLSLPATASPTHISKAALKKIHRLHLQAVISPQAMLEKELPDLTLPERINFIVGDSLPDFLEDLENFVDLLSHRPHLHLELRGCYDDADREYLLRLLQEEEDYRTNLENIRRQEEMAHLLAEEELRQVQLLNTDLPIGKDLTPVIEAQEDLQTLPYQAVRLPKKILPELARQRARVVQAYLIDTLKLPAEKIIMEEVSSGGPWVDLSIKPYWPQPAQTTQVSEPEKKE